VGHTMLCFQLFTQSVKCFHGSIIFINKDSTWKLIHHLGE